MRIGSFLPFFRCCVATPVALLVMVLYSHRYIVKYSYILNCVMLRVKQRERLFDRYCSGSLFVE